MGFWSSLLSRNLPPALFEPQVQYLGYPVETDLPYLSDLVSQASPSELWRQQPHLRSVVSFLARNLAQLGLHSFERVDETDRRRDRTSPLALALRYPDLPARMTSYATIFALVGDLCLYDRAYWLVVPADSPSGFTIRRLPPSWVSPVPADPFTVGSYLVGMARGSIKVPASQVLDFTGYSPTSMITGSPTIEGLRGTLQEQIEAAEYRLQVWKRGGRVSSVLERPTGAPEWTDEQRERFREDWYATYTGRGPSAGGTPILEDGMKLNRIDFNAKDQQFVEAAQLAFETVAMSYHVNPAMMGRTDGTTFASMREMHRMLYVDTLGPLIRQVEDVINTFLPPMLGMDPESSYVEFNVKEKLRGSFEEQTQAMQGAVGGPWMTRNEARARENLPAVDGGDELITPLNVTEGGQTSPLDSGSQNQSAAPLPRVKAAEGRYQHYVDTHRIAIEGFFRNQSSIVQGALRTKSPQWWDRDRWDKELADNLFELALTTSQQIGRRTLDGAGIPSNRYNVTQTVNYLRTVAEAGASRINASTLEKIQAALAGPVTQEQEASGESTPHSRVDDVFTEAKSDRAAQIAQTTVTATAGFAVSEAARQQTSASTKTWMTGSNPRSSHAALDGETVGIDETFSNGMRWPGAGGDADEVAGCNCTITVNIPDVPQEGER